VFKDVSELKAFIIWAKDNKINALKVGEVEIHFSPLAHTTGLEDALRYTDPPAGPLTPKQIEAQKKEDLDLLFHSAT